MGANKVFRSNVIYMSGSGYTYPHSHSLYISRGAGVGSIFTSLYSSLIPIVKGIVKIGTKAARSDLGKAVLKDVKRTATQAGLEATGQILQGENVLKASKTALKDAGASIAKQAKARGERALAAASSPIGALPAKKTRPSQKKKKNPPTTRKQSGVSYKTMAKSSAKGRKRWDILD